MTARNLVPESTLTITPPKYPLILFHLQMYLVYLHTSLGPPYNSARSLAQYDRAHFRGEGRGG